MVDLKQLLAQLKQSLDREKVTDILSYVGYEVRRDFKFAIRDEKTPSASINNDGYIKDFGDGWGGDIFDLLQKEKGLTFHESIKYVADCMEVHYE